MHICEYIRSLSEVTGRAPVIGFVGLGVSNTALLSRLSGYSGIVTIRAKDKILRNKIPPGLQNLRIYEGENYLSGIFEDVLFLSPSVFRGEEIRAAENRGCRISSDAELFFLDAENVYAITGSDGKSTTATMTKELLALRGRTELCGNIGRAFAECRSGGAYVAELSSFQLEYLSPKPRRALITSLSPNHLDWHVNLENYISAKLRIFDGAEYTAMSADGEISKRILEDRKVDTVYSLSQDRRELASLCSAKNFVTSEDGKILINGDPLISLSEVNFGEWYNIHNLMGAISLTLGEVSAEQIKKVAGEFSPLPHRAEIFKIHDGVTYIDSSIDTTPARTAATLTALGRRVILILGGGTKGLSILPIIDIVKKYSLKIALYGEAGLLYKEEFDRVGGKMCEFRYFEKFDHAVDWAFSSRLAGYALLLSPAGTGYGEFADYKARGEHFKSYIKQRIEKS